MSALHGQYDVTIDARRRLRVPRQVARLLGERADGCFVMIRGRDGRPWMFTAADFGKLVLRELADGRGSVVTATLYLKWDGRRQITLPRSIFIDFALKRELTLVGVRDRIELWNRDEWDVYSQRARGLRTSSRET
jgi:DNA-binding transcriptional regulator/RsmH inhibitor MraZ